MCNKFKIEKFVDLELRVVMQVLQDVALYLGLNLL